MFFDSKSNDCQPMAPEELNALIEMWGKELFAEEKERCWQETFINDNPTTGPTPATTRAGMAFVRAWSAIGSRSHMATG